MKNNWIFYLAAGILSLLGGLFSLANPFAATLTATMLAGWSFLFAGILTLVSAFREQGTLARVVNILLGAVVALLGFELLADPLQGTVSLTIAVAVLLVMAGIFRIITALRVLQGGLRWGVLASGVLSLVLAAMIFGDFPQSAAVTLGIFLAVELISNGLALIALAVARKQAV